MVEKRISGLTVEIFSHRWETSRLTEKTNLGLKCREKPVYSTQNKDIKFEKMSLWDRAGFLGKAAWDIHYPIDVLGFAPSQVMKAAPGTLLSHIMKNGIEINH